MCFDLKFTKDLPIFLESQTCKKMGQNEEIKNMSELKPRITENGIDYILVGDYYIPDLKLPEEHRPIGKYGRMHREYLREVHPARLNTLILTGGRAMDISCRPERTGTGTVRHHHGADESRRGCDGGIEANPTNGMGEALQ